MGLFQAFKDFEFLAAFTDRNKTENPSSHYPRAASIILVYCIGSNMG
jgi:hypothetical protein